MCTEQCVFEQAFRTYRHGLHATCRGCQGCHVTSEEQFLDLLSTAGRLTGVTETMKLVITGTPLTAPEVGYALVLVQ